MEAPKRPVALAELFLLSSPVSEWFSSREVGKFRAQNEGGPDTFFIGPATPKVGWAGWVCFVEGVSSRRPRALLPQDGFGVSPLVGLLGVVKINESETGVGSKVVRFDFKVLQSFLILFLQLRR